MLLLVALVASAGLVLAQLTPTAPGPGDSFAAGGTCTIDWRPDQSGQWTNVTIYMMSGSNDNMSKVSTVSSALDGTDPSLSPYHWTCPDVHPYSNIYFYQFTNGDDEPTSTWTTRFTITSPDGDSEPPEHDTQPNGDAVPWGTGYTASGGRTSSEALDTGDVKPDTNKASRESDDGTPTNDPSPSAQSDYPGKSSSGAASEATGSPLDPTTNSQHARPTHSLRPSSSGEAAENIPTASYPYKKAHASATASTSTGGMSCSGMGPSVPQVGGMKLASGVPLQSGSRWSEVVILSSVLFAALL